MFILALFKVLGLKKNEGDQSLNKHSVYVNKMCFALYAGGVFIQHLFYLNSFQLHEKL